MDVGSSNFESLVNKSTNDNNIPNEYIHRSHKAGRDITINDRSLSLKAWHPQPTWVKPSKKDVIKICKMSSYRLTKAKRSLPLIVDTIKKNEEMNDYYLYIINSDIGDKINSEIYLIPNKEMLINDFEWNKNYGREDEFVGFKTTNTIEKSLIETMYISFSQSDQLWIDLNYDMIQRFKILNFKMDKCKINSKSFVYKPQ